MSDSNNFPASEDPVAQLHQEAMSGANNFFSIMEGLRAKFLPNERDDALGRAMKQLIANAVQREDVELPPSFTNRARGSGLVLLGPTGVGKSRSLERFFDNHRILNGYKNPASKSPLVSIAVPSPCTSMQLARSLLRATGYGVERDLPAHRLWEMAFDRLVNMRKFIVHFDEMQHVVHNMPEKDLQQMADTLKNAMYKHRITLVISGVDTLENFLHFDPQLFRRLSIVEFSGIEPDQHGELLDMVEIYADEANLSLNLRNPNDEADSTTSAAENYEALQNAGEREADFIARLSLASLKAYGYSIVMTHLAIEEALQCGTGSLTQEHFATVYARKTGAAADRNPFITPKWHHLDCAKMFEDRDISVTHEKPKSRKGKK